MKIMIVGHGRHGKDTVAQILADQLGLKFTSSSLFCAERVMMPAFPDQNGNGNYATVEQCFNDRANHRKFWYDEIVKYCTPDKARLVREIFQENDIYVGIRQVREFFCAKNEGLFDCAIWVDRSEVVNQEPSSSMAMQPWMCDYWLDNNGTIEELTINIQRLLVTIAAKDCGKFIRSRLLNYATEGTGMASRFLEPSERVPIGNSRPAALEPDCPRVPMPGEALDQADGTSYGSFPPHTGGRP